MISGDWLRTSVASFTDSFNKLRTSDFGLLAFLPASVFGLPTLKLTHDQQKNFY